MLTFKEFLKESKDIKERENILGLSQVNLNLFDKMRYVVRYRKDNGLEVRFEFGDRKIDTAQSASFSLYGNSNEVGLIINGRDKFEKELSWAKAYREVFLKSEFAKRIKDILNTSLHFEGLYSTGIKDRINVENVSDETIEELFEYCKEVLIK